MNVIWSFAGGERAKTMWGDDFDILDEIDAENAEFPNGAKTLGDEEE